jgi:hypothetical protein
MDCPHCKETIATCTNEAVNRIEFIPWSGIWPGVEECQEFGWYAKFKPGEGGWIRCDKDDPEGSEDLNRLCVEAKWDREKQRMVKREE